MYKKIYILIMCVIFSSAIISSAPPITTVQQFADGLIIVTSPQQSLQIGKNFTVNFFVHNQSNGLHGDNTTINCSFYMAFQNGTLLFNDNINYNTDNYWSLLIKGGNFSWGGQYNYGIYCNTISLGGTTTGAYIVTESGVEIMEGRSILAVGLLGILILFLFLSLYLLFTINNHIGKFALYWITHLLIILITFTGWQIGIEGLLGGMALIGIFRVMFLISIIAVVPMIFLSLAWIFYIHTFNEHFQKLIDKGEHPESAFSLTKRKYGGWFYGK